MDPLYAGGSLELALTSVMLACHVVVDIPTVLGVLLQSLQVVLCERTSVRRVGIHVATQLLMCLSKIHCHTPCAFYLLCTFTMRHQQPIADMNFLHPLDDRAPHFQ